MGVHHHKAPIVTDGLVFHIDAGNNICNESVTQSKNAQDPSETANASASSIILDNEGVYTFDNMDDYIDLGINNKFNFGTSSFTVSVWFNVTDDGSSASAIYSIGGYTPTTNDALLLYIFNNDLYVFRDQSLVIGSPITNGAPSNTWVNAILVRNLLDISIWVDGVEYVLEDNSAFYNLGNLTGVTHLGRHSGGRYYGGFINNFTVYDRALTDSEVIQNYNSQKHRFE